MSYRGFPGFNFSQLTTKEHAYYFEKVINRSAKDSGHKTYYRYQDEMVNDVARLDKNMAAYVSIEGNL